MNKRVIQGIIMAAIAIMIGFIIFQSNQAPVWEENAIKLNHSFNVISGEQARIGDLAAFVPFEWDTMYSFAPYTPMEVLTDVLGKKYKFIEETTSEDMNQVVFLKKNKVVCYISGNPDKYNIRFDFGAYNDQYIKLMASDKIVFNVALDKNGIRKLTYVNGSQNIDKYEVGKDPTILSTLAEIPQENIYLYRRKSDLMLYFKGERYFYEWGSKSQPKILPKMYYRDVMGEEKKEIVIISYGGSGTGVSIEELHIIETSEFKDYTYRDFGNEIKGLSETIFNKEMNTIQYKLLEQDITIPLNIDQCNIGESTVVETSYTNIIHYSYDDSGLRGECVVEVFCDAGRIPQYIGIVEGDIVIEEGKFIIKNPQFSLDPKMVRDFLENEYLFIQTELENKKTIEDIKKEHTERYDSILKSGYEGLEFLKEKLQNIESIKEKRAVEHIISDIIKSQVRDIERLDYINKHAFIKESGVKGKILPSDNGKDWTDLELNQVVFVVGKYDRWNLVRKILPDTMDSENNEQNSLDSDLVEFWVKGSDINQKAFIDKSLLDPSINIDEIKTYQSIVKNIEEESYDRYQDEMNKHTEIHSLPSLESDIIGFVHQDELVRIKEDYKGQVREGEWVLIEQVNRIGDYSTLGWIEEKYIEEVEDKTMASIGFVSNVAHIYGEINGDSVEIRTLIDEAIIEGQARLISIVFIEERRGGWAYIINEDESIRGWVKEEELIYKIPENYKYSLEKREKLSYFEGSFISKIKSEIVNNETFKIKLNDLDIERVLTLKEREELANSIIKVEDAEFGTATIIPERTAVYPYYSLSFMDEEDLPYEMVLIEGDRLLLVFSTFNQTFRYGIDMHLGDVESVKLNDEFVKTLHRIAGAPKNNNQEKMAYLLNADRVTIKNNGESQGITMNESDQLVNCMRTIKESMGERIPVENVNKSIEIKVEFIFTYKDGRELKIICTDQYILWKDVYYQPLHMPEEIQGNIFSGGI